VQVLLLRHGQSEWNAVKRWQGTADSPLTGLGREQAIETAWALAGVDDEPTSLWSSDLRRAYETATIIGEALGLGVPNIDPRLREAYAGEWEGLTPADIEVGWPGWLDAHRRPTTFEPFESVVERAHGALAAIADVSTSGTALVVSHSGLIRSVARHLGRHDERVPNLGGIWLTVGDRSATGGPDSIVDGWGDVVFDGVFDPHGIVISGVDAPGEDPGEQPDQTDAHDTAEH
jgi:broad specificity phosphatase PhoE